jgi:hypothetical protein
LVDDAYVWFSGRMALALPGALREDRTKLLLRRTCR